LVTVALSLLSATAFAKGEPLVATLSKPVEKQKPVLASMIWRCEGTTCTSASPQQGSPSAACRAVAKRFGPVVSFTSAKGEFTQEQLAQCNRGLEQK
jgi:hypothetical protein